MTDTIEVTNVVNHEDGGATAKKFLESLPITLQEKVQKAQKKTWRIASQKPVRPPQQLLTEYAEITPMLTVKAETYRTVMTSHMSALK